MSAVCVCCECVCAVSVCCAVCVRMLFVCMGVRVCVCACVCVVCIVGGCMMVITSKQYNMSIILTPPNCLNLSSTSWLMKQRWSLFFRACVRSWQEGDDENDSCS